MSSKIDSRQVLSYLNQLGYTNIDASQLQAFIKDLKKLVKYEERQVSENNEVIKVNILSKPSLNVYKTSSSLLDKYAKSETDTQVPPIRIELKSSHSEGSTDFIQKENIPIPKKKTLSKRPITAPVYPASTPSSQSLLTSQSEVIACPVHHFRGIGCPDKPRDKALYSEPCSCPINAKKNDESSCTKDKVAKGKRNICSTLETQIETNITCSRPDSFEERTHLSKYCPIDAKTRKAAELRNYTHDFTHPCYCPGSLKPRSAVIKINIGCKPRIKRCDPVSLHQYYKKQWQINPIPGENKTREQRFRWCFREKISSGPPVKKLSALKI